MRVTFRIFIKCLLKSGLWLCLNLFYGLAPILVIKYLGSLHLRSDSDEVSQEEIKKLVQECSILFILCVVMGAVTIDFLFSRIKMSKIASGLMIALSVIPLFLIGMPYAFLVFDKDGVHTFNNLIKFQNWFTVYCVLYCIIGKSVLFIKEENTR